MVGSYITFIVQNCDHEYTLDCKLQGNAEIVTEGLHLEDIDKIEIDYGEQKEGENVDPVEVGVELFDTHNAW